MSENPNVNACLSVFLYLLQKQSKTLDENE